MAQSTDTKVNEFIINATTEELLKTQTIQPNQIYVTPDDISSGSGGVANLFDTSSNLTTSNPILENGQLAIESDTGKLKVGNGVDHYNDLDYFNIGTTITVNGQVVDTFNADTKIDIVDIIDNLTTIDATKVLSANQGVELKNMIEESTPTVIDISSEGIA